MQSIEVIKNSILEINKQLKKKDKIKFKKEIEIIGPESKLDSLIIVNLFIAIEERIKKITGKEINLLNEDLFEKGFSNGYTLEDLQKEVSLKLAKKKSKKKE